MQNLKIIFLAINIMIVCNISFAFDNLFEFEKIILLNKVPRDKDFTLEFKEELMYAYNNLFGLVTRFTNELYFNIVNLDNSKIKSYKIIFLEKYKQLFDDINRYSQRISFDDKHFFLNIYNKIFFGELPISMNREIYMEFLLETDISIDEMKSFEDTLILVSYQYHGSKKNYSLIDIIKVNIRDRTKVDEFNIPNAKGWFFTLFYPPEPFDFTNEYFIVSEITDDKLLLYDKQGRFMDTISLNDNRFVKISDTLLNYFSNFAATHQNQLKSVIDSLRETFYHKVSRIERVDLINSRTILVYKHYPSEYIEGKYKESKEDAFDIIALDGKGWEFIARDIKPKRIMDTDTLLKIMNFIHTNIYFCSVNRIITFSSSFPFLPEKFETRREFLDRVNNFYKKNPLSYSLLVYKFVL